MPILMVSYFYSVASYTTVETGNDAAQAGVTVQIPFEAGGSGSVGLVSAGQGSNMSAGVVTDQVHVLTNCDPITTSNAIPNNTGLPCPPLVTHADASLVSASHPANAGEELVVYTIGLGQTNPALTTGKLVVAPAPTVTTFGMDFNFRPNSLATKPLPTAPAPVFAGATPGYVGLYQVNFIVPQVPAETLPCFIQPANTTAPPFPNVVVSNLTVSIGGVASFDGAGICVAVPSSH